MGQVSKGVSIFLARGIGSHPNLVRFPQVRNSGRMNLENRNYCHRLSDPKLNIVTQSD